MSVHLDVLVFLRVECLGHMAYTARFKNKSPSELSAHRSHRRSEFCSLAKVLMLCSVGRQQLQRPAVPGRSEQGLMALAVLPPRSVSSHPSMLGSSGGPVGTLHILIDLDLDVSLCKIAVVESHLSECFLCP